MVYTADSPALAALELLVQLNDASRLSAFVLISLEISDKLVKELRGSALPAGWRAHPAPPELQARGDAWIQEASSVVLRVPSAIEPRQHNFLVNPEHPQFRSLKVGKPEPYAFDLRLMPRRRPRSGG